MSLSESISQRDPTSDHEGQKGRKRFHSSGETSCGSKTGAGDGCSKMNDFDQSYQGDEALHSISDLHSEGLYSESNYLEPPGDEQLKEEAYAMFEKGYTFVKENNYNVPTVDKWFCEKTWTVHSLKTMKHQLNAVKEWLNDMGLEWHDHTTRTNKAGDVIWKIKRISGPELVTQAWCKFYEIVCSYPIVPTHIKNFLSIHLCEAPGAFITALNYYLCSRNTHVEWEWMAGSLNPYYEGHSSHCAITDDRLIFNTFDKWEFGSDTTGDIMDPTYLQTLRQRLGQRQCNLVTADGSIDCLDNPGEQENIVAALHFAEVVTALHLLSPGGSLVIKKFTLYECLSICIMYMLTCFFKEVNVFKPSTSKAGNSEVYLVCLNYEGSDLVSPYLKILLEKLGLNTPVEAMFPRECIPNNFLEKLEECCRIFLDYQQATIKENLELFYQGDFQQSSSYLDRIKMLVSEMYLEKFRLNKVDNKTKKYRSLCRFSSRRRPWNCHRINPRNLENALFKGSYNEKQALQKKTWIKRLCHMEERIHECFSSLHIEEYPLIFQDEVIKEIASSIEDLNGEWIKFGKPYNNINNSKFANSCLIELWNEISHEAKVLEDNGSVTVTQCCWSLKEHRLPSAIKVLVPLEPVDDSVKTGFLALLPQDIQVVNFEEMDKVDQNKWNGSKLVLFDLTSLNVNFLKNENLTKLDLTRNFIAALQVLQVEDCLAVCFHSILTRVTVGVFYLTSSLFERAIVLPSKEDAIPTHGQVWIFVNFQKPESTTNVMQHLTEASSHEVQKMTLLEVVPIITLCRSSFYNELVEYNNKCLMKKITQLIRLEKEFLDGHSKE